MPAHYFTVEEANRLLVEIRPLMAQLLERRAGVVRRRDAIADLLDNSPTDFGGPAASRIVQDFIVIEDLIKQIKAYGCVIKDLNVGLIDFLAEKDGREVYLCWRFNEPRIEYYHELHTGFSGREHI